MNGRHNVIPAIYLVFEKDGQVLLLRRANTGYMDGKYSLPAGHVDAGESALAAAVREAKEEVGLDLDSSRLRLVHAMHRQAGVGDRHGLDRIDLFFRVMRWDGEPQNMEPHKCDELRWTGASALPDSMIPEVRQALEKIAADEPYSDRDF